MQHKVGLVRNVSFVVTNTRMQLKENIYNH